MKEREALLIYPNALEWAIANKNLELLQWLKKEGFPLKGRHLSSAASLGNVAILSWMLEEEGFSPEEDLCLSACKMGNKDNFDWLVRKGFSYNQEACQAAMKKSLHNKRKVLKFLDKEKEQKVITNSDFLLS